MSLDPDRRAAAVAAKLAALVAAQWDAADDAEAMVASTFAGGATQRRGHRGWVLVDQRPERGLGAALAWAHQQGVTDLNVVVDARGALLARRAQAFRRPPVIWQVDGRTLHRPDPAPFPAPVAPSAAAELAAEPLRAQGVEVVVEHGEIFGEVHGLEVARVVVDDQGAHLEVGVGRHDREAFAMLHGDLPPASALAKVVATVEQHRRPGAPSHPLNRLGAERWLRSRLLAEPGLVGAAELWAVETPVPRANVKEAAPAAALGRLPDGAPVVVVCSTGIDLDLVPAAADTRLAWSPEAELVLAVPERDAHRVTRSLADALVAPAAVVTVEGEWQA
ncbi:MAG TPA: hypothetical protein VIJ47_05575 [Acidimicrobiales bacterium]